MTKKYYKALLSDNSSICGISEFTLRYELNEWVTCPYGNKLFVFDSIENARRYHKGIIYECEIQGGPGKPKIIGDLYTFKKFWSLKKQHKKVPNNYIMTPPKGTRTVDAVKITKLVYDAYGIYQDNK